MKRFFAIAVATLVISSSCGRENQMLPPPKALVMPKVSEPPEKGSPVEGRIFSTAGEAFRSKAFAGAVSAAKAYNAAFCGKDAGEGIRADGFVFANLRVASDFIGGLRGYPDLRFEIGSAADVSGDTVTVEVSPRCYSPDRRHGRHCPTYTPPPRRLSPRLQ